MLLDNTVVGIEADIYSFLDRDGNPRLAELLDAHLKEMKDILSRHQHRVLVDDDCRMIRRLDRWERRSTHTG